MASGVWHVGLQRFVPRAWTEWVHLQACAGAGKTSRLVATAAALVGEAGLPPHRLHIFSYTNGAADEISERFEAAARPAALRVAWLRWRGEPVAAARRELSKLRVLAGCAGTFHSFAGEVAAALQRQGAAFADGLPPRDAVIGEVARVCGGGGAAAAVLRRHAGFQVLFIDEAQDNCAQKTALAHLLLRLDPCRGCHVVGDRNQSIYALSGARPELFDRFFDGLPRPEGLPPAGRALLDVNHRCPWGHVAAANAVLLRLACMEAEGCTSAGLDAYPTCELEALAERVLAGEGGAAGHAPMRPAPGAAPCGGGCGGVAAARGRWLRPEGAAGGGCAECEELRGRTAPVLRLFATPERECRAVCAEVRRLVLQRGIPPQEVAVLHRNNRELLPYFGLVSGHGIPVRKRAADAPKEAGCPAVELSTVHSAKGAQWRYVFLVGLSDATLPCTHDCRAEDREELRRRELEELRLLYVGMTRATAGLQLSCVCDRSRKLTRFLSARELAHLRLPAPVLQEHRAAPRLPPEEVCRLRDRLELGALPPEELARYREAGGPQRAAAARRLDVWRTDAEGWARCAAGLRAAGVPPPRELAGLAAPPGDDRAGGRLPPSLGGALRRALGLGALRRALDPGGCPAGAPVLPREALRRLMLPALPQWAHEQLGAPLPAGGLALLLSGPDGPARLSRRLRPGEPRALVGALREAARGHLGLAVAALGEGETAAWVEAHRRLGVEEAARGPTAWEAACAAGPAVRATVTTARRMLAGWAAGGEAPPPEQAAFAAALALCAADDALVHRLACPAGHPAGLELWGGLAGEAEAAAAAGGAAGSWLRGRLGEVREVRLGEHAAEQLAPSLVAEAAPDLVVVGEAATAAVFAAQGEAPLPAAWAAAAAAAGCLLRRRPLPPTLAVGWAPGTGELRACEVPAAAGATLSACCRGLLRE